MKNKLEDLNNHLFMQLERLNDETFTDEQLEREAKRAKAVVDVANQITTITGQQLKAVDLMAKHGDRHAQNLVAISGPAK